MKIAVRLEGGAGDCLLGNRFVAAIKEKYPNSKITAYIDSEGKTFQKEILEHLYGSLYEEIKIIPSKKYKNFWVDCQFGQDNYYGALENVPDDIIQEMQSYDKFYDLHIDSMKWVDYDFDWLRYYRFFPKPERLADNQFGKYVVFHLISSTSVGHRLEEWYIDKLISEIAKNHKCLIISTPDTNQFYDCVKDKNNIQIFNGSIQEVCSVIGNAQAMVSTDSGFRYVAYGYGVPTLTFSKHSHAAFSSIPSHQLRWLMFPETCFPLHHDAIMIGSIINKIASGQRGYILAPYMTDFDNQAIRRKYTINKELTK